MKTTTLSLLFVLLTGLHAPAANPPAKVSRPSPARVVCFNGKLDSGSSCSGAAFQPGQATNRMTCGFRGKVSEIEWSFIEKRGSNDVYRFKRRFPSDTDSASVTNKTVEFRNRRVVVFQDTAQAIVIEPPKSESAER